MRIAVLIAVVSIAAGCYSVYEQPKDGSRARIRFVANNNVATSVRIYDEEDCQAPKVVAHLGRLVVAGTGFGVKLGMPLPPDVPENAATEIFVPTGRPITVGMSYGGPSERTTTQMVMSSCAVTISFDPVAESDYEAVFRPAPGGCNIDVSKISGNKRVRESSTRTSAVQCPHFREG